MEDRIRGRVGGREVGWGERENVGEVPASVESWYREGGYGNDGRRRDCDQYCSNVNNTGILTPGPRFLQGDGV